MWNTFVPRVSWSSGVCVLGFDKKKRITRDFLDWSDIFTTQHEALVERKDNSRVTHTHLRMTYQWQVQSLGSSWSYCFLKYINMYIMNALSIKNKTHPHTKKQPSTSGDQHHKPDNIIKHCYCISKHHLVCMAVYVPVCSVKRAKLRRLFSIHTNTHLIKCCFGSENIYFLNFILLSYTQTYNV